MKEFIHLARFEKTLFGGAEWTVKVPLWLVLRLSSGVVYVSGSSVHSEPALGGLIVIPPDSSITVLVSVLGQATLHGLSINVNSLSGLLTLGERVCLEKEVSRECAPFRLVTGDQPLAVHMSELCQTDHALNLPSRLGVVQSFAQWVSPLLGKAASFQNGRVEENPKERLKKLLNSVPESELIDLSLAELAKRICCCERHASRLFHELCGCGFRKYVLDLRLKRACHLLVQGDHKIIDVAFESGHSSLALFNYNFKNRFNMTPTEWRQRHLQNEVRPSRANAQLPMALVLVLLAAWLSVIAGWVRQTGLDYNTGSVHHNGGEICAHFQTADFDCKT